MKFFVLSSALPLATFARSNFNDNKGMISEMISQAIENQDFLDQLPKSLTDPNSMSDEELEAAVFDEYEVSDGKQGGRGSGVKHKYNIKKTFMKNLEAYGCWCTFGENFAGMGIPVDSIDRKCKALNEAYECANMEVNQCVPWEVEFNLPEHAFNLATDDAIRSKCIQSNKNKSPCQKTACMIQVMFVNDLFDALFETGGFAGRYKHDNRFRPERDCKFHNNKVQVDRQCCGQFPKRKIFNNAMMQCCADGKSRIVC